MSNDKHITDALGYITANTTNSTSGGTGGSSVGITNLGGVVAGTSILTNKIITSVNDHSHNTGLHIRKVRMGPLTFHNDNHLNTCTKCKRVAIIALSYKPYKDCRFVCDECTSDMFDKLLGINNSTEKLLYRKPE